MIVDTDMANHVIAHLMYKNIKNNKQSKQELYDILCASGDEEFVADVSARIKKLIEEGRDGR